MSAIPYIPTVFLHFSKRKKRINTVESIIVLYQYISGELETLDCQIQIPPVPVLSLQLVHDEGWLLARTGCCLPSSIYQSGQEYRKQCKRCKSRN